MFGTSRLNKTLEQYHRDLNNRLESPKTAIFIDTNILAYFYRLFSSARQELAEWFKSLTVQSRLKVPAWAASEYFLHTSTGRLRSFAPNFNESQKLSLQIDRLIKLAMLVIDDKWLTNKSLGVSRDEYLKRLKGAAEDFRQQSKHLGFDDKQIGITHDTIQEVFGGCVVRSDLSTICQKASTLAPHRYAHRMPPGYEDRGKDENSHGDFIIWLEILEEAKNLRGQFDRFIFITNDEKKDWTYTPQQREAATRTGFENNSSPEIKVADPRLVLEFSTQTGCKEDFEITSIEHVITAISQRSPGRFKHLSAALQILQEPPNTPSPSSTGSTDATQFTITQPPIPTPLPHQLPLPPLIPPSSPTALQPSHQAQLARQIGVSATALCDNKYQPNPQFNKIDEIISNLRSYNWYTQNPAIIEIDHIIPESHLGDSLFVLGRNILQSAHGNALEAVSFMHELSEKLRNYPRDNSSKLLAGIAYEVYFDGDGALRKATKAQFLSEIFEALSTPTHAAALEFIRNAIAPYRLQFDIIPGDPTRTYHVQPSILRTTRPGSSDYLELSELLINSVSMFTEGGGEWNNPLRINDLYDITERNYAIPVSMVKLELSTDTELANEWFFLPNGKRFKSRQELFPLGS
ncbi:hypothetical protein HJC10_17220 [Corallococcus exiguus]|nr:hypothetical protein [Corallococcus exiguus]